MGLLAIRREGSRGSSLMAVDVSPAAGGLMDAGKRCGFGRLLLGALVVFVSLAVGDVRMMEAGIALFAVELL